MKWCEDAAEIRTACTHSCFLGHEDARTISTTEIECSGIIKVHEMCQTVSSKFKVNVNAATMCCTCTPLAAPFLASQNDF